MPRTDSDWVTGIMESVGWQVDLLRQASMNTSMNLRGIRAPGTAGVAPLRHIISFSRHALGVMQGKGRGLNHGGDSTSVAMWS